MRTTASILHLDLDAFFASVEQRDKPSLRGKPVIVGGIGPRGVVATASYEARKFGVKSAMRTAEARARCPHGAYLAGRFDQYRQVSQIVMQRLYRLSPIVQPLSLDEAFVDLNYAVEFQPSAAGSLATLLTADVAELTGGLTASIGIASSKLMAKIATELNKPAGTYVVAPGSEEKLLGPMPVTVIPGVGPATTERLRRIGVHTVDDVRSIGSDELIRVLGQSAGSNLYLLAFARDDRAVIAEREAKSVSVEDTFSNDVTNRAELAAITDRMSHTVADRLAKAGLSGRTITIKIRHHDFDTHTRSQTLAGPTDNAEIISDVALRLLSDTDVRGGLRLLGVGVSGLADWVQDELFSSNTPQAAPPSVPIRDSLRHRDWATGMDVQHTEYGPGWVWGSGMNRVTVRFETRDTPPGPVRTFAGDDPALSAT